MIAAGKNKLKLGKGVALIESPPNRVPQVDETWEAE